MAVRAVLTTTIYKSIDISSTRLYYKLVNAGSSAPSKPANNTTHDQMIAAGWSTAEPTFDVSKDLYATMQSLYTDNSTTYSDVTKYSSYEAAKLAYNTATNAQQTANAAEKAVYHNLNASGGTSGYFYAAQITILQNYANQPWGFSVVNRSGQKTTVSITFKNANSLDPGLDKFYVSGSALLYMVKADTSIWDLYIKKSESYDNASIVEFYLGGYMSTKLSVVWKNSLVTTLPEGYITATLLAGGNTDASYKTLIDGKIESYYQSSDPSSSWSTNVEKEKHIGDIWYNTTNQKTFVYYKNNTNPVTYEWKWQNVPTELIDSVNGKATIYSGVIPANYSVGDYWLIPLNCYTNTYSLTSQTGEYSVNQTIKLDRYTLTVTSVNSSTHAITGYTVNVPSNSNYSLAETISDGMLTLTISSTASFTLPTGCYGGSMCVATTAGTSYNASHWVKRNDYTPKDKTDTYATEVNLNDNVLGLNGSINSNYTDLEGQINDTYITLNGKIDDNYSDLSGVINSNVGGLDSRTSSLEDYRDTFSRTYASDNDNIRARETALEDRLVKTIQSTSGGSNLLRNSVGFRGTKYWTSPSSGIIEQSFLTVPQQTITVNFKWKKPTSNPATITLGYYNQSNQFVTAYTVLTTSSNVSAWSTASFTYTSNVNNPVIRFNDTFTSSQDSDAYTNGISGSKLVFGTSGLVITDLIIAYGNGQNWSPYYSELYGSTFNLDADGLDIRASLSDKHSHLDANMLAFLGAQDTVEGLFSKNETRTDNLYLTNAQYIGNLHIINIDNNNIIEY